mgnify:FL=1
MFVRIMQLLDIRTDLMDTDEFTIDTRKLQVEEKERLYDLEQKLQLRTLVLDRLL